LKAVVMAGGYGTTLRPLTIKRLKPMMPVAGRPILEHIVMLLLRHGFTRILIEELGDETKGIEGVHLEDEDG
jgi:mannose-1-phosphate guanylyltransferase/phosphomannomutase